MTEAGDVGRAASERPDARDHTGVAVGSEEAETAEQWAERLRAFLGPANGRPQQPRRLSPAVRRAAARMVVAANRANGETPDPKILAIAEDPAPDTT
jgi:hypothetical protein